MDASNEHSHGTQRRGTRAGFSTDNQELTSSRDPLSLDAIFSLLRNHRRRMVIRYLSERDGQGTIGMLAEHLAAEENGITVQEVSSSERKRTYIALYQVHLPKLADYGVIEFNKAQGAVELAEAAEALYPYLEPEPTAAKDPGSSGPRSVIAAIREWLANRH